MYRILQYQKDFYTIPQDEFDDEEFDDEDYDPDEFDMDDFDEEEDSPELEPEAPEASITEEEPVPRPQ